MTSIWERCRQQGMSLNEIVSAFEARGEASELISVARSEEDRSSALYVLAELRTSVTRPVWRSALVYAADEDDRTAFYALDIFHSFAIEAQPNDLLIILRSTDLARPALFAKLFAIMLTVRDDLLQPASELAGEPAFPDEHAEGLALLVSNPSVSVATVRSMVKGPDVVTRFYGCCLIGRHHPKDRILGRLLPSNVQRRLALHY
jgi:hypothetical protein